MNLRIESFSPIYLESIREFNRKFDAGNVRQGYRLPETFPHLSNEPFGSPRSLPFEQRQYLVLDDDRVAGGFMLQEQMFQLRGRCESVANIQLPISLGLVDRGYASAGGWMIKSILARKPLLFAVGMGNEEMPFPRLLKALRWNLQPVPFHFYILRPARFLRQIQVLQKTPARSWAARIVLATGLGWAGIRALHSASGLISRAGKTTAALAIERVDHWGTWVDELWNEYRNSCSLAGIRDRNSLPLYQSLDTPRFYAYRFRASSGQLVGWGSLQIRQMQGNAYFDDLVVAALLDTVAVPGWEDSVARAVLEPCSAARADLIVSNQRHQEWISAFKNAGFLSGPSNYLLGLSPALAAALEPLSEHYSRVHISRADGDGRIHL